jgi:hypothetical protein
MAKSNMKAVQKSLIIFLLYQGSLNFCMGSETTGEVLDIQLNKVVRPVSHAGSGWLSGAFSNELPDDSLLLPLKTQRVRAREEYITSVYEKCKSLGISIELVTNKKDDWNKLAMDGSDDMTPYIERHKALVKRMQAKGMGDLSYSIFQESNARGLGWVKENEPHYLEAYRLAYMAIKEVDPEAIIVGPNAQWGPWTWWWSEHEGDYTFFIRKFIDYCTENNCMPDIIAWHDGYHCDGFGISNAADEIRAHLEKKGIGPIPLEQDDVGCKECQFRPGSYVSYLAHIERAGIKYTCKCCWDRDCHINTLQGLLTKSTREPRSLWWMYKSYGDLLGHIVETRPGESVDGVVSLEQSSGTIKALIGRYRDRSEPVTLRFRGISNRYFSAQLTGSRIENSEDLPLAKPPVSLRRTINIEDGQIEVILDDLNAYDAYAITIKLE